MMVTYRAGYGDAGFPSHFDWIRIPESEMPTVIFPLKIGRALAEQFFLTLSDEAKVKDPGRDEIVSWGDLRKALTRPLDDPHREAFWVAVVEEVWQFNCAAHEVVKQIDLLHDQNRRRNRQIEDLRGENKKLREKLVTLGVDTEPARS